MGSTFEPPNEDLISDVSKTYPCREPQIRALTTLLHPNAAQCKNLVLYGSKATGKSAITRTVLEALSKNKDDAANDVPLAHAIVSSARCITGRHLFETTVAAVAKALEWDGASKRCENLAQLAIELSKMLLYSLRPDSFRFVLVFDGIDLQREAPHTLLPALARLHETIPCLATVFIVTTPSPLVLRTVTASFLEFPNYKKFEFVKILALDTPPTSLPFATPQETADLWTRFCGAVHDSLAKSASRTLPSFRHGCHALWPRFVAPVLAGTHSSKEFSKLLIASRVHFQDEALLNPSIIRATMTTTGIMTTTTSMAPNSTARPAREKAPSHTTLTTLLPTTARLLLLSAYLASYNPPAKDFTVFSTHTVRKRGRGGRATGRGRSARISRKLLGAQTFVLERMTAIFTAVRNEWAADQHDVVSKEVDADVGVALATLASLRLVVRVGTGDLTDMGARWRVNVGLEAVRGVGRSLGVEVEDWLIE
ncbi:related to origin recognition complex subunit 5 [Cephalotrichum gorgonifer]|uniref:Related to origin recognition complex subunit 5 n=1 Tax=Cephalotrichum gorgonifer TaxID=2041049 RepID=A0AAE8SYD9_9PEZI|nr:related to origin recognition complex subunit 5 [Cephalotrichum gorgonifer]